MKNKILTFAAVVLTTVLLQTGCDTPAKKVENAQENVDKANKDLDKANQEYLSDIESYRKETNDKIAANNKSLANFKARTAQEKRLAKSDYNKKINDLEQTNSDMQKELDDYKADGKDNWERFKMKFNHDMDSINKSFQDLSDKVTK